MELEKDEMYFDMKPEKEELTVEAKKKVLKKEVDKHELDDLQWAIALL